MIKSEACYSSLSKDKVHSRYLNTRRKKLTEIKIKLSLRLPSFHCRFHINIIAHTHAKWKKKKARERSLARRREVWRSEGGRGGMRFLTIQNVDSMNHDDSTLLCTYFECTPCCSLSSSENGMSFFCCLLWSCSCNFIGSTKHSIRSPPSSHSPIRTLHTTNFPKKNTQNRWEKRKINRDWVCVCVCSCFSSYFAFLVCALLWFVSESWLNGITPN